MEKLTFMVPSTTSNANALDKKRVTVAISVDLDRGLELYCAGLGKTKNEVVTEALVQFLRGRQDEVVQVFRAAAASASTL
jgi:hypothetical protein